MILEDPQQSLLSFPSNFSLGYFSLLFFSLNLNVKGKTSKEWYSVLDCVLGLKNRLNIVLEILSCPIAHCSISLRKNCNFSEILHGSMKNELNSPTSPARISIKLWNVTSLLECQDHYCLFQYFHERHGVILFQNKYLLQKHPQPLNPRNPAASHSVTSGFMLNNSQLYSNITKCDTLFHMWGKWEKHCKRSWTKIFSSLCCKSIPGDKSVAVCLHTSCH